MPARRCESLYGNHTSQMSKIEWTEKTWNPVTGCNKVSQGCKNCYAEVMHRRLMHIVPEKYSKPFLQGIEVHESELNFPLTLKKPTIIFVNSMSDLFHKDVPFEFIQKVFTIMWRCPHHIFQIVTKRPEIAIEFFSWLHAPWQTSFDHFLPNVWIGVSCEDQDTADKRVPYLLKIPAAIRFLSCEPLLGPIELEKRGWLTGIGYKSKIDWVIVGGESGRKARPMHPNWLRSLFNQCRMNSVAFFFKQWGNWLPLEYGAKKLMFFCNDYTCIDAKDGLPEKYNGRKFMTINDADAFCIGKNEAYCGFIAQGNKPKFDNKFYGDYYQAMPIDQHKTISA
jgi:protein gp37